MGWTHQLGELAAVLGVPCASPNIRFSSVSTDSRTLQPGALYVALRGERYDGGAFVADAFQKGAVAAVVHEPAALGPELAVKDTLEALQACAAWHRSQCPGAVFALTGSCGKTTAKECIASLLATRYATIRTRGNFNNEIGCPLSLLQMEHDTDWAVIEMGANHRGEVAKLCSLALPRESAITMIGEAHLEGFGSLEGVAEAKGEIISALPHDGVFYLNTDNPWCVQQAARHSGEIVKFGSQGEVRLLHCELLPGGELSLEIAPIGRLRLPLPVPAAALNVLLAVAVGLRHGVEVFEEPLRDACLGSKRHSLETVGGITILNDSYNANPSSVTAALEALAQTPAQGKRIAVLGEMLELGENAEAAHVRIGEAAAMNGVDLLLARGPHACAMIEAARNAGLSAAEAHETHEALAAALARHGQPGDVVLLKGSRGMAMEKVLPLLQKMLSSACPNQEPESSVPPEV